MSIDGEKVPDVADLLGLLGRMPIGGEAKFVLRRAGQEKAIVVKGE